MISMIYSRISPHEEEEEEGVFRRCFPEMWTGYGVSSVQ